MKSAAKQAGTVLRSKKATTAQKHEAVKVLGTAIATESAKKVTEHVVREARKSLGTAEGKAAVKAIAKRAAPLLTAIPAVAISAAAIYAGVKGLEYTRRQEAVRYANAELDNTRKRLTQKLTDQQSTTLWKQYYDFAMKRPVENPFLGK